MHLHLPQHWPWETAWRAIYDVIFPKGADLSTFTLVDLQAVEDRLNDRPRKILSWRSPTPYLHRRGNL